MWLDERIAAQKKGLPAGIVSVCSVHLWVLRRTLQMAKNHNIPALIESTCNQVNPYGGYTGMTPADFAHTIQGLAKEIGLAPGKLLLGGDHLGPYPWRNEPADQAMDKATELVSACVQAGYTKIHLDCSMPLGDDPPGPLDPELATQRAAQLAKVAEETALAIGREGALRYVVGTEVPIPGGATDHEGTRVTPVEEVIRTIELTRQAFQDAGVERAWDRVIAVVVQPGVEFGDDFVLDYDPQKAQALSRYIATQPLVYEAHSTDYQTREALAYLVRDHFAILKVGPALTFAFREAIFALAMIEAELYPPEERSNLREVLDEAMRNNPAYWQQYYTGTEQEIALKRRYSLSDRIRYYWNVDTVQAAVATLLHNLETRPIPMSLISQFAPSTYRHARKAGLSSISPQLLIADRIDQVLEDYFTAAYFAAYFSAQ